MINKIVLEFIIVCFCCSFQDFLGIAELLKEPEIMHWLPVLHIRKDTLQRKWVTQGKLLLLIVSSLKGKENSCVIT